MAHDIWSKRFYSARNKPAWHGISLLDELGIQDDDGTLTAGRVMEMMGNPTVERIPLTYSFGAKRYNSGYHALMRPAMIDDPFDMQIGVVSEDYELITPSLVAEIWDKQVGLSVETLAFLKRGATVFITGKLPAFDVAGEPVENYLICNNPMDGKGSASGHVANIRVVCQNTLRSAISNSSSTFKIEHRKGSAKALAKWLGETYRSALMTLDVMKEAYDVLAKKRMDRVKVEWIVEELYPMPQHPNPEAPRRIEWEDAIANYEYRVDWVNRARKTVMRLNDGAGTGLNNRATEGTAWGAWNAVAEFETYRRGTSDSIALNVIDGDRGKVIMRAYDQLVKA
jgi:hypothetical protein